MKARSQFCLAIVLGCLAISFAGAQSEMAGKWKIDPELSSAIDPWRTIELTIETDGAEVGIEEKVSTGRRFHVNKWSFNTSKRKSVNAPSWWVGNRHIGAFYPDGEEVVSEVSWLPDEEALLIESNYRLVTNQGGGQVREHVEYRLSKDRMRLTRITLRSTRDLPVLHVFKRQEP